MAGFAVGLWGTYRSAFPAKGLYRVSGVFQARAGDVLFIVAHDPVSGLMPEMPSMAISARSKALLDQAHLEPGDRVRLTVTQTRDEVIAVEIRKIR